MTIAGGSASTYVNQSAALHVVPDHLPSSATPQAKARAQATEFEQVFLSTMLNQMFSGLSTEAPFGGGQAEETWRGMLVERYADTMAKSGGIGVADAVYDQLLQVQEGARA